MSNYCIDGGSGKGRQFNDRPGAVGPKLTKRSQMIRVVSDSPVPIPAPMTLMACLEAGIY
jgi:hypothetical protein